MRAWISRSIINPPDSVGLTVARYDGEIWDSMTAAEKQSGTEKRVGEAEQGGQS